MYRNVCSMFGARAWVRALEGFERTGWDFYVTFRRHDVLVTFTLSRRLVIFAESHFSHFTSQPLSSRREICFAHFCQPSYLFLYSFMKLKLNLDWRMKRVSRSASQTGEMEICFCYDLCAVILAASGIRFIFLHIENISIYFFNNGFR